MKTWLLAVSAVVALTIVTAQAEAGFVAIGFNIGGPIYPRPWYGPCWHPYYRPYPVYVGPSVYVAPAPVPVYVEQPPVVVQPAPVVRPTPIRYEDATVTKAADSRQPDVSRYMQSLFDQEERVRSDAAIELGRLRSQQAIDPLTTLLTTDRSPLVRETAARALGLIGNARSLPALQNAAQADSDRDVRRSAQFAAEVIRTNLRRE
jgi:hypothetical protein